MKIGILRETKVPADVRVPLTPGQCRMLEEKFPEVRVYVQPSPFRCFPDSSYSKEGIMLTEDLHACDIIFGVKEVDPDVLIKGKTYFFFSHTIKKQNHNRKLLRAILNSRIRLVDYEMLTDSNGGRIIGFGRWAGLIGSYLGIRAFCIRQGLEPMPPPQKFRRLPDMIKTARVYKLPQLKIAITGDGRVGSGACEMMDAFRIRRVASDEFIEGNFRKPIYTQLGPDKYNRSKDGSPFGLTHFFNHPDEYKSNFSRFCESSDLLIAAAYWDPRAPLLFTGQQLSNPGFRIKVIADISCDLNGSIPSTIQTTTFSEPYYDFNPSTGKVEPPFSDPSNITVMSIDNLPCGLPAEASSDFGQAVIRNILPLLMNGDPDGIIQLATITHNGFLTEPYQYLQEWVTQPEGQL